MNEIASRIQMAIETTKRVVPGYFEKTVEQRLPSGAGSIVSGINDSESLENALKNASWDKYDHAELMPGTEAFITHDIHGQMGVVNLDSLDDSSTVKLDDRKNTGKVSCVLSGARGEDVDFTVIILGQENGEEVVFTFHPGAPVRASQVVTQPGMHGQEITVAEAREMGLTSAKIV